MKLTVIGGGGVRSMFLAKSIARRAEELGITQLVFMDNDAEKLRIYGGMARQVAQRLAPGMQFVLAEDAREAVTDADYVITTIRVGGDGMRVRDERIALSHAVLGQETTGAAGLAFAMRSVPALAEYCELVKQYAKPGAKVFNFTNPAGVVSQALQDMGYDFTYGICDAPSGMLQRFARLLGAAPDALRGECYGLNHLSYFSSITLDGKEVMPQLMANPRSYVETDLRFFEPELVEHLGCVPNEYLYYFYYREKAVQNILAAPKTRGESIAEINAQMTAELAALDPQRDFEACLAVFEKWYGLREAGYMASETGVKPAHPWTFDVDAPDDGGYAGVALQYIATAQRGGQSQMILCVPNEGAVPGLADSDTVEVTCDISAAGHVPHKFAQVDERHLELIRRVKMYERLAARAIVNKSIADAEDALMLHPLVNSWSLAKQLVPEYLQHNAAYTQGWT